MKSIAEEHLERATQEGYAAGMIMLVGKWIGENGGDPIQALEHMAYLCGRDAARSARTASEVMQRVSRVGP